MYMSRQLTGSRRSTATMPRSKLGPDLFEPDHLGHAAEQHAALLGLIAIPRTVNGHSKFPTCGHRKFPHPLVESD